MTRNIKEIEDTMKITINRIIEIEKIEETQYKV